MQSGFLPFLGYALLLALFVEGIVLALFPDAVRRMMGEMAEMAPGRLRLVGLVAAVVTALVLGVMARLD